MSGTCQQCKHWGTPLDERDGYRPCGPLSGNFEGEGDGYAICAGVDGNYDCGSVYTRSTFGCRLFTVGDRSTGRR